MSKKWILFFLLIICLLLPAPRVFPADDETPLFTTSARPEALIVLDLSGSMNQTVHGEIMYAPLRAGASNPPTSSDIENACYDGPYYPPSSAPAGSVECAQGGSYHGESIVFKYGDANCVGPFYKASGEGHTRRCDRLMIAKSAILSILNADGLGGIDATDEAVLGIDLGYIRFKGCDSSARTGDGYDIGDANNTGCIIKRKDIPTPYYDLYYTNGIEAESASGLTPLALALDEARLYLDNSWKTGQYEDCPKKYILLVTDGWDTVSCTGTAENSHKNRKATVKAALRARVQGKNGGYPVFVIGFGAGMPEDLKNTLNWTAKYGGTDNTLTDNTGNPDAVQITTSTEACADDMSNDPGMNPLSGYAYLAESAEELTQALQSVLGGIAKGSYSFTTASVASSRIMDENFLYQAFFKPVTGDPFWPGSIKKYSLNPDGSLGSDPVDAGEILKAASAGGRNIYTRIGGVVRDFRIETTELSNAFFGASTTDDERKAIIGYIRGESAYNKEEWKLGDTFHSDVRAIGVPSPYYNDVYSPGAFRDFREDMKTRKRIVVAGANDGQLHAFFTDTMVEAWSFIPPNLLPKLKYITHSSHPAPLDKRAHQYFVDGPLTAADVWLGSGDGTNKDKDDWRTLLVIAQGRGVRDGSGDPGFLWSSSIHCDQGFNKTYSDPYHFYCGYHALDVTDTGALKPTYLWRIRTWGVPAAVHLSEPWSRMAVGRVKIGGKEKWVGFIGGGLDGKGFFVIDLGTTEDSVGGDIRWSYTKNNNAAMEFGIPASPTVVDVDNDGFIDTAYVGDRGGNMWRFKFCMNSDGPTCNTNHWQGGLFFDQPSNQIRPIFTTATAAKDSSSSLWVFWGTGDKLNPTEPNAQEKFYALSDDDRTKTYNINDLINIAETGSFSGKKPGWYINLAGQGEKMLSDPTVFGGVVLFTTYTPHASGNDLCAKGGDAKLYAMAMMTLVIDGVTYDPGAGLLSKGSTSNKDGGAKSISIGMGIPAAPVISQPPGGGTGSTDLYVPVSGAKGKDGGITTDDQLGDNPLTRRFRETFARSQIIHWRDMRLTP